MTADREQRNLRGPVRTVRWEVFEWDNKAGAVREKPNGREELTFSPATCSNPLFSFRMVP